MNKDQRLGELIKDQDSKRDAVHVAVYPMVAKQALVPGQKVNGYGFAADGDAIGCVDPFLSEPLLSGDMFWCLMIPGTVQNLRHVWDHADLEDETKPEEDYDDSCRGCY